MSNIRVTYSGLIAFATSIGSTITGLFFIVIVTRQLIPEDFGLWTLIGSLVSYVAIIQPIVTYWTTRQIARGEAAGKTALFSGGLLSVVGFTIYSIIAITVSATMGVSLFILMLAAILVPLNFLNTILNSISLGFRPQNVSYGLLAFEFSKLPLGFILVYIGQLGIIGVLLTIIIAHSLRIIFLVILTREKIVAAASRRFVCIVDDSKLVERLGAFPLPIEVLPMAVSLVTRRLAELGGRAERRADFTTDNGNIILDVHDLELSNPQAVESELDHLAGVVASGLFCRRPADLLLVGGDEGVESIPAPEGRR